MNPFEFKLTIILVHPVLNPAKITAALGIQPFHCWQAGQPRTTRDGQLLIGENRETYWCSRSTWKTSTLLGEELASQVGYLESKAAFLSEFHSSGGQGRIDIAWATVTGNSGLVFGLEIIGRVAALILDIGIDFYCKPLLGDRAKNPQ
jgi:hypothetical protein